MTTSRRPVTARPGRTAARCVALSGALIVTLSGCGGAEPAGSPSTSGPASSPSTSSPTAVPPADPTMLLPTPTTVVPSPDSTPPPAPAVTPPAAAGELIAVSYAQGAVSGRTGRVKVPVGGPVTLQVTSDTADEVHLHGYDRSVAVAPGAPASLTFDATIPGVFEVELEDLGVPLLSLQVG